MAFLGVFGALGFGRFGYSAILPSMQDALGLSTAAAGSLASWNLAGYTVFAAIGGLLASRFGARVVLTAGMLLTGIGIVATGLTNGLLEASIGRLVTGFGNGMILVPSITLMASWFDRTNLGLASSIVPTGSSLALIVAGPTVPRLVSMGGDQGWRVAWFFFAGITLLLAVMNTVILRDNPQDPGFLRNRADLFRLPWRVGAHDRTRHGRESTADGVRRILRSGHTWHLAFVYFTYGISFLTYFTFFQKRLSSDLAYSPETAGNLFILVGIAGLVGGVLWGVVSDRVGRSRAIAFTMLLAGVSGLLFAWGPNTGVLALSALLFGSTGPIIPGLIGAVCGDRFGPVLASTALGLLTVPVGIGQAVGPYLGGLLGDVSGSLGSAYLLCGIVFIIGGITALTLRDQPRATIPIGPSAGNA